MGAKLARGSSSRRRCSSLQPCWSLEMAHTSGPGGGVLGSKGSKSKVEPEARELTDPEGLCWGTLGYWTES
ncbi:unnamed protein product [Kuraishia capsulata CBS 1993]|uniref:Uncharacterized protein n=1 Tax=Kuraishia capsulata CBS 1993 TaxID=1382522 RepID=W6MU38_9ASCO|nr:uncharacterized protein KUCA_T00006038001 [Kuraishia capsulata CBS 1993]CDK30043.1 unnamed protein product [Kuraishia capsulata CBS 1993]